MNAAWLPFLVVVVVAYAVPGPDLAVILRAAAVDRRCAVRAAAGAQTGLCVHMLLAAAGLSLLLARAPGVLTAMRFAGAAYLVYLGVRAILAAGRAAPGDGRQGSTRSWFVQGLVTNLLNPKAVLFFASILPQFVDPAAALAPQILALGVVDVLVGVALWAVWIVLTGGLAAALADRRRRRLWDRATGGAFVAVGVALVAHT